MDAGLHGVELQAPGRIASTVGKMRGEPSETPENDENPAFLLRMVKRDGLAGVKSDRLLDELIKNLIKIKPNRSYPRKFTQKPHLSHAQKTGV